MPGASPSEERIQKLCRKVLAADDSILAVALCNYEGRIRGTELRKDREPWKGRSFDSQELSELTKLLGPRVGVVIGVADQNTALFGPLECIVVIYGRYQILLTEVPDARMNLALMLTKSCDTRIISSKVSDLLLASRQ
jgi:hypothetical protein